MLLLLDEFRHVFSPAQNTEDIAAENFMNRCFVIAAIEQLLSDQRIRRDAFQLFREPRNAIEVRPDSHVINSGNRDQMIDVIDNIVQCSPCFLIVFQLLCRDDERGIKIDHYHPAVL